MSLLQVYKIIKKIKIKNCVENFTLAVVFEKNEWLIEYTLPDYESHHKKICLKKEINQKENYVKTLLKSWIPNRKDDFFLHAFYFKFDFEIYKEPKISFWFFHPAYSIFNEKSWPRIKPWFVDLIISHKKFRFLNEIFPSILKCLDNIPDPENVILNETKLEQIRIEEKSPLKEKFYNICYSDYNRDMIGVFQEKVYPNILFQAHNPYDALQKYACFMALVTQKPYKKHLIKIKQEKSKSKEIYHSQKENPFFSYETRPDEPFGDVYFSCEETLTSVIKGKNPHNISPDVTFIYFPDIFMSLKAKEIGLRSIRQNSSKEIFLGDKKIYLDCLSMELLNTLIRTCIPKTEVVYILNPKYSYPSIKDIIDHPAMALFRDSIKNHKNYTCTSVEDWMKKNKCKKHRILSYETGCIDIRNGFSFDTFKRLRKDAQKK